MTGVLHPVGPEPPSTYWLRRALVVGVVAVLIAIVAVFIPNGSSSQLALPAAPGPAAPPPAVTSSTRVTSSTPVTPAPATPSTSPTPTKKADSSAGSSAPSKAEASRKAEASSKAEASRKSSAKATPARPAAPQLCDPGKLRAALTGVQRLRVKKATVFNLSLINGSATTCRVSVNAENFELKIYSGKDRIWSTGDCSTAVRSVNRDVASQRAAVWRMKWNGLRSAAGCKSAAEVPKPGSYVVTAQHSGAKPVKMRMILTG